MTCRGRSGGLNNIPTGFSRNSSHLVGSTIRKWSTIAIIPLISNIRVVPTGQLSIQSNIVAFAHVRSASSNLNFRTEGLNSKFSCSCTTSKVSTIRHSNSISTSLDNNAVNFGTSTPRIDRFRNLRADVSFQDSAVVLTNNGITSNVNQTRNSFHFNLGRVLARSRGTTISCHDSSSEFVITGNIQYDRNSIQVVTRDCNTVLIPYIMVTSNMVRYTNLCQRTFTDRILSSNHCRNGCIDRQHIHVDRVFSGASLTIIQDNGRSNFIDSIFLREYGDSRIITVNTIPCINNISCPAISVSIQDNRLASAIDFRNCKLNVSTEATHFERSRSKLTTIGRLHCYRVNTRLIDSFCRICAESSFTRPSILIGTSRNNNCNKGGIVVCAITVLTKNICTDNCDIFNRSINCENNAIAQSRRTANAVGFNFDDILTRIGQSNAQRIETSTGGNHCAIQEPFVMSVSLCIGHANLCNAIRTNTGAANSCDFRSGRSSENQHIDGICSRTRNTSR